MDHDELAARKMGRIKLEDDAVNGTFASGPPDLKHGSQSPIASPNGEDSRSGSMDTPSSQKPKGLTRRSSQKLSVKEPQLFDDLPDATAESCADFQVITDCLYGSKNLGSTDNDAFDCDCREDWQNGENCACGEDSDCINRATKMECSENAGNCGGGCHNQRFQRKEYARVSVIKTEKKGYGLRTDAELHPNDFIYEYIGEVINEPTFRRRMLQYDEAGIKHFYFMSLRKNEFVDATRRGNLGRFCNHSCNPNCYVDKWVVGDKLRMGIFALRRIRAGEELVFNYNVDRYGADPQPCYCGEPNCVGFIGGKTQTERATKLPAAVTEALGIDDGDGWDTSVARKPRRKRADEDDEDYVNSIQPRSLDEDDARKVMAALMQCKEKWIAVKLLERIQRCDEERVIHCVIRMHAYQILKTTLNTFIEDFNVVLQVLSVLDKFPRLTRNKIQDSKIEDTIERLAQSEHEEVSSRSKKLLEDWSKLEVAYRIQRRKVDPNAPRQSAFGDRRGGQTAREEETSHPATKTASPRPIDAPKGPRSNIPQRNNAFFSNGHRPRRPPFSGPLPQGWFSARDARGSTYFYNKQGTTTWQRPTQPAIEPSQKGPTKAAQEQLVIQNIINRVTKEGTPKQTPSKTPQSADPATKEPKQEKWRALPIDKQMKIYENTLFPHVKPMLDKFRHKLPKDELKRLGKDIAKKLVASDYKNKRVEDPNAEIPERTVKKIQKYVYDFMEKAVAKYSEHQKRKAARSDRPVSKDDEKPTAESGPGVGSASTPAEETLAKDDGPADDLAEEDVTLSDVDLESPSSADRKRKHEAMVESSTGVSPQDGPYVKRLKEDGSAAASPPPPPPPPPEGAGESNIVAEEERALREQEEALMRENEEAQRLEDEAKKTKLMEDTAGEMQNSLASAASNGSSGRPSDDMADSAVLDGQGEARKQEVMSH